MFVCLFFIFYANYLFYGICFNKCAGFFLTQTAIIFSTPSWLMDERYYSDVRFLCPCLLAFRSIKKKVTQLISRNVQHFVFVFIVRPRGGEETLFAYARPVHGFVYSQYNSSFYYACAVPYKPFSRNDFCQNTWAKKHWQQNH